MMIEWWGPIIHEFYAGSEGNGFIACNSEEWLAHEGTVGKPIVGIPHICDDNGQELPIGKKEQSGLKVTVILNIIKMIKKLKNLDIPLTAIGQH